MATVHFMSQNFVRLASVPLKPQLQTLAFDGWVLNAPALLATAGQEERTAEWKSEACTLLW